MVDYQRKGKDYKQFKYLKLIMKQRKKEDIS